MRARTGMVPLGVLTVLAAVAVTGCGSSGSSVTPAASAPGMVAPNAQNGGTSAEIASSVDVIDASIVEPAANATQAQLEMTLAVVAPGTGEALTSVSTPAAARATLLSNGRPVSRLSIPDAAGDHIAVGPPAPDEVVLAGLRPALKPGQSVKVTISFGAAGSGTLNVPVTTPP